MKRRERGVLTAALVLLALAGAFLFIGSVNAAALQEGDFTYEVNDGKATITGYMGSGGAVIIPSTLGGYPTDAVGTGAFYNNPWIEMVVVPNSVTTIGRWAFSNCSSLERVEIGSGVAVIGDSSFDHCANLASVRIESGSIGTYAFWKCTSLTSVDMGNGVVAIGNYAFWECANLASVIIPDSVTTIGIAAFYSCTSLTSVTIPDSVTSLGTHAFWECSSLTSLSIGRGVTVIGSGTFRSCYSLTYLNIPDSVTSIDQYAFFLCTSLTTVSLGNGVTSIGGGAFSSCTSLDPLIIPDNVRSIASDAFSSCTSLTWASIGKGVTSIGSDTFSSCTSLISMTFVGSTVPRIGSNWIQNTPSTLTGHAYAASGFPARGSALEGLMMGAYIPTVPGEPVDANVSPGNGAVTISWSAPNDDGGAPISDYRIYRSETPGANYTLIASTADMDHIQTGLVNGRTYWYMITAVNSFGEGGRTEPISVVPGTPSAPRNVSAAGRVGGIALSWDAPDSTGGSSISTYVIYQDLAGDSRAIACLESSTFAFLDSNVTYGSMYAYHVVAVNAVGAGASSEQTSAAPQSPADESVPQIPRTDDSMLYLGAAIVIIATLAVAMVLMRRK